LLNKGLFMKIFIPRLVLLGAATAALVAAEACSPQNVEAQTQPAAPAGTAVVTGAPAASENSAMTATPVKAPPDIFPTSPLAQVARLTQAGVDQGVILTYVTNSSSTFNLDSDRIIYLSDLGAPSSLITAMMQRDQELQAQFAASQSAQQASQIQPAPAAQPAEPTPAATTDNTGQPDTQPAPVTVNYFYNSLAPYGSWIVVNGYGRCWRPAVCVYNSSWQPYCDRGNWVYSDCGWYWNSSYAWGATFHYGRWFNAAGVGWCWYPDTVWAPSWVTWRYSNNYCGWAPLPPHTAYRAGVGIVYNGVSVGVGFSFGLAANCFTFVPTQRFCDPHPHNYRVAPTQVTQVYNNTTVINNYNVNNRTIVNHGIAVGNVAAATRTTIQPVPVREINAGYARAGYGHPAYQASQVSATTRPGYHAGSSTPVRTVEPGQNWNSQTAQPQHNVVVATIPQRSMPAANYNNSQPQSTPTQVPAGNFNGSGQPAASQWHQSGPTGTPRNYTHNYGAQQHRSGSTINAPPPHAASASAPAGAQSFQGGNNGGHQNWPGH
jgi:hypothetical protein